MVFLKGNRIDDYPNFDSYLQYFVQVMDEPRIWDAFLKWSCLDESTATKCVSYATWPMIVVPPPEKLEYAGVHGYGHFDSSKPNEIGIEKLEKLRTLESPSSSSTSIYNAEKYLQKLILHELVHWGRYWAMESDEYVDKATWTDTGDAFEIDAYANPDFPHL